MQRRRLTSGTAGVWVPGLLAGVVRIRAHGAVWLWCDGKPYLMSRRAGLLGPITAQAVGAEDLEPGEWVEVRVSGTRVRGRPAPEPRRRAPVAMPRLEHEGVARLTRELGSGPLERIARDLAGLGPGLTPSGDDVLTGYMLARQASAPEAIAHEAATILDAMRTGSGEPALSLAGWAAQGESFAVVLDARDALLGAHRPGAIERLVHLGSESGRALLAGMAVGLAAG